MNTVALYSTHILSARSVGSNWYFWIYDKPHHPRWWLADWNTWSQCRLYIEVTTHGSHTIGMWERQCLSIQTLLLVVILGQHFVCPSNEKWSHWLWSMFLDQPPYIVVFWYCFSVWNMSKEKKERQESEFAENIVELNLRKNSGPTWGRKLID